MSKERQTIEFEMNISEKQLAILPSDFNGTIIVKGNVNISKDFSLPCSLLVTGHLNCQKLELDGELHLVGTLNAGKIHVSKNFYFKGKGNSDLDGLVGDIIVGGNFYCEAALIFDNLSALGTFELKEFKKLKELECQKVLARTITGTAIKISQTHI